MKGNEIKNIRKNLDLSIPKFSKLLGVHVTTGYRWENQLDRNIRLDPLHSSLLLKIRTILNQFKDQEIKKEWTRKVLKSLTFGGTLCALAFILRDLDME